MNRCYLLHPGDYAIGDNEKWYADMAARGWRLVKRGIFFSRFERACPEQLRYRIELTAPDWFDEPGMPAEQVTLYEDCGWHLAAQRGIVNIFCAPVDSDVPELYTDPRQQAAALRRIHRRDLWSYLWIAVILAFNLLPLWMMEGSLPDVWASLGRGWRRLFVEQTALALGIAFFVLCGLSRGLWDSLGLQRLYCRLKRGIPLNHAPRGRKGRRALSILFGFCSAVFILLAVVQYMAGYRGDLPQQSDGPYLLLKDLGWQGTRTSNPFGGQSRLEQTASFLASCWDTSEYIQTQDANVPVYLFQEVYRLQTQQAARSYIPMLMADATFADGPEDFTVLEIPGLDGAWRSGDMEYVILCGRFAAYITYGDEEADPTAFLSAYAEKLAQWQ